MQLEVAQKLHIFAFDFFIGTSLQELAIDWQNWPSWQQSHQMISTRFGKASARQRWKKFPKSAIKSTIKIILKSTTKIILKSAIKIILKTAIKSILQSTIKIILKSVPKF